MVRHDDDKHPVNFFPDVEWEEAFLELDKDHSGKIDATELIYVIRALGHNVTLKEVQDMINEEDVSGMYRPCLSYVQVMCQVCKVMSQLCTGDVSDMYR